MKLHANAPLGPKGRAIMVRRIVEEGWSLDGGGRGRRSERATCRASGPRRYRAEGEAGLVDRSSAPKRVANRTAEDASRRSRPCGGCG